MLTPERTEEPLSVFSPFSPLGTPATERAARIARDGLDAAEALEAAGMPHSAAELKASALVEAAEAYRKQRQRRMRKGARSPLHPVATVNGAAPQSLGSCIPEAVQEEAAAVAQIQAVVISGTSLVHHRLPDGIQAGRPFTLWHLHVPLCTAGQHVAFRRYSDFVALDGTLRRCLREQQWQRAAEHSRSAAAVIASLGDLSCLTMRPLPALPPKTLPFVQDPTAPALLSHRWAGLQRYLDAALERAADCPPALDALLRFLCLD